MKNDSTENQIKQGAMRLFFAQGRINARMQEIADEAGVNRALLHYYFRNREELFETVLKEAINDSFMKMFEILSGTATFENKIRRSVSHLVDQLATYPYIETFIISEINKNPLKAKELELIKEGKKTTGKFLKEIAAYLKKHKMNFVGPKDFIVNMMALCAYPASTKPIVSNILGFSEKQHNAFVKKRKKIIIALLLHKR